MLLEDFQFITVAYADCCFPEMVEDVLRAVSETPDWELEVIIAAEAIYAEQFLSPN